MRKSGNIPVSHGRGSVVGSLVSYALKITDIDPIFYGLLFEIFLNPEIESVIDIDINFFQSKRDEIVDYIVKKYGKENVAKLIAFEKLSAKETIKNITKALNISPIKTNKIIKLIPNKPTITLKTAYKKEPKIKKELQNDLQLKRVWDYAIKLEGLTKGIGFNTSGLVISNKSLLKQAPLLQLNKQKIPIIQYNNQYIKYVNLIKFDLIKFNILDKIEKILKLIEKNHQQKIDFSTISLNDKKVFETISSGKTMGMFLIKNYGIQYLIKNFIKPSNFEDLSAILALYRIGPMECGMLDDFIERKYGRADIDYFFDEFEKPLKPILESTYGTIIYQEQVIQILQTIGGFSLIKADIIRRALEKEQFDLIQKYKEEFIKGAQTQGYQYNNAAELFKVIEYFAKYCFNKSHAVAYAIISYQTAYLKTYYPKEFISVIFKK
jgi:DNA polymerase-3 subunit alpha